MTDDEMRRNTIIGIALGIALGLILAVAVLS